MKNLIRQIISGDAQSFVVRKNHPLDFIKSRRGILRELMISKESGDLIGVFSPALGEGMFLMRVLGIESEESEEVIAFQKYDVSDGRTLAGAKLNIGDIKAVCPFINMKWL